MLGWTPIAAAPTADEYSLYGESGIGLTATAAAAGSSIAAGVGYAALLNWGPSKNLMVVPWRAQSMVVPVDSASMIVPVSGGSATIQ